MPFLGPKWSICPIFGPNCPEQKNFGKNHYYYFGKNHYLPIGPFHCVRFKKILTADPIIRMYHFWTQNGLFAPNQFFFKNYWYYSHLHISPFHWAKFLKNSSPELWGCAIFEPRIAHFFKWEFFLKTCLWALFVSFIHACRHAKNQSQKSEILKSYWPRDIFG